MNLFPTKPSSMAGGLSPKGLLPRHRFGRLALLGAAVAAVTWGLAAELSADGSQPITRVEEDWQITFGSPDPNLNVPQVTMTMSPFTSLTGPHAVFEINQCTQPGYQPGGLQLQRWWGDSCQDFTNSQNQNVLQLNNDVLTFTMSVQVQNGTLTFGVSNANSQTWGTSGSGQAMTLSTSYGSSDLSLYDPNASLANSYVGFGSNRVQQAVRTQIRYYSNGTLIGTDSTQSVPWQYIGQ